MSDKSKMVLVLNPSNLNCTDTDYYVWLLENDKKDIHAIFTKKEYLEKRFDFVKGQDTLNKEALMALKWIEDYYFDVNLKEGIIKRLNEEKELSR